MLTKVGSSASGTSCSGEHRLSAAVGLGDGAAVSVGLGAAVTVGVSVGAMSWADFSALWLSTASEDTGVADAVQAAMKISARRQSAFKGKVCMAGQIVIGNRLCRAISGWPAARSAVLALK